MTWSNERSWNGSDSADASTKSASPPSRRARDREHLRALVDAGDLEPAPQELARDEPGPRRDVEDVAAARRQPRDEKAPPERILAQRESRRQPVVRRAERSEERASVLPAARPRHGSNRHGSILAAWWRSRTSSSGSRRWRCARRRGRRRVGRHSDRAVARTARVPLRLRRCGRVPELAGARCRGWLDWRPARPARSGHVAVLCEVAAEAAGGGDLDGLLAASRDT